MQAFGRYHEFCFGCLQLRGAEDPKMQISLQIQCFTNLCCSFTAINNKSGITPLHHPRVLSLQRGKPVILRGEDEDEASGSELRRSKEPLHLGRG